MDILPDHQQSLFNSAMEYNRELTTLRRKMHDMHANDEFLKYYKVLIRYHMALEAAMTDSMKKEHQLNYNRSRNIMIKYQKNAEFGKTTITFADLQLWENWERSLRACEQKLGLLMPKKEDPGMSILGSRG